MHFKKSICKLLFCLLALSARATTWCVAPDGDDGAAGTSWGTALLTIGTGVSKASAPDTVLVSNGVYMLPGEVWVSKGITIRSVNGRDVTVVNGNNPATGSRCFTLNHVDAVLDGFTITNGMTSLYGGGVYVPHGTVRNCIITGNKTTNAVAGGFGGGLRLNDGLVSNCIAYGNSAPWLGGGVSIGGGLVHSCIITGNVTTKLNAGQGGGVHLTDGVLSNCVVSGNSVDWFGSGVYIYNGIVTDCVISENTCGERGAGLYVGGGGTVRNSAIMNNWPRINEGAVDMGCYEYVEEGCVFRFF